MGHLGETLSDLQRKANHCAWLFQSYKLKIELQVVYATGVAYPWRLLEVHRTVAEGVILRRMHCFADAATLEKSLEEHAQWKSRDRALCAAHLPGSSLNLAQRDPRDPRAYEGFNRALAALEGRRRALREQICITRASHVLNLSTTPTFSTKRRTALTPGMKKAAEETLGGQK